MSSESPDDEYARLESDAYQMLFDLIRSDVIENEKVVRLSEMRQLLLQYLMSLGAKECKPSTKKHIKRNIEAELNELIRFENLLDNNRVQVLIPNSLTPVQIARNVLNILMAEKEDKGSTTKISNIQKAAADIRDAAPERYQVRPVSLQTFTHQARKTITMPSGIGFPTMTSDVLISQPKTNLP